MPFLRFTRDKRGYESTCVWHTYRRGGKQHARLLYWFRTPPQVKVGRLALDEDAIRALEEANPDLTFDWPKMLTLQVKTPEPAPVREARRRRPARVRAEKPLADMEPLLAAGAVAAPRPEAAPVAGEAPVDVLEEAAVDMPARPPHPVVQLIGEEGLARLRALYAALQARIGETVPDPVAREMLRVQSEALNPDTWATEEEARQGLEEFERQTEAIRARLGRRRRIRRGGRRKRGIQAAKPLTPATTAQPEAGARSSEAEVSGEEGDRVKASEFLE